HEEVVEAVQARLDKNSEAMRTRRETIEHPFGTMKMRMGATHFLTKTLPQGCHRNGVACGVLNIVRVKPIMAAGRARMGPDFRHSGWASSAHDARGQR